MLLPTRVLVDFLFVCVCLSKICIEIWHCVSFLGMLLFAPTRRVFSHSSGGLKQRLWQSHAPSKSSGAGSPNLQDPMPDDLRWSWCNNNRNKVHNKSDALESPPTPHPTPAQSMEKLFSTKPDPDVNRFGDHCSRKWSFCCGGKCFPFLVSSDWFKN